jgi:hypothetical protein
MEGLGRTACWLSVVRVRGSLDVGGASASRNTDLFFMQPVCLNAAQMNRYEVIALVRERQLVSRPPADGRPEQTLSTSALRTLSFAIGLALMVQRAFASKLLLPSGLSA